VAFRRNRLAFLVCGGIGRPSDEAIDVFHEFLRRVVSVSDTQGSSSEEGICLLGPILGEYRSFINPPRTPFAKEWELVAGGATALTLAMVYRGESFDRAAVLLQSTPHPSPLPKESLPRAMSPVNRAAPVAAILPNNGAEHLLVIASLH
jgi:hypothetical protein